MGMRMRAGRDDYAVLIHLLKDAEETCQKLVAIIEEASRKAEDINDYTTRMVDGEIQHLVLTLEPIANNPDNISSFPRLIGQLERAHQ